MRKCSYTSRCTLLLQVYFIARTLLYHRYVKLVRHWDDHLLRSVLCGNNTTGKMRKRSGEEDVLREKAVVILGRVRNLEKEKK